MALYEITQDGLKALPPSTFEEKQVREREDLQRLLKEDVGVLSPDLLVVAEEFGDWEDSRARSSGHSRQHGEPMKKRMMPIEALFTTP